MRQSLVYVVDEDDLVRQGLERVLRAQGHAVESFADGRAFLDAVDADALACALLGDSLSGASGLAMLASLRDRGIDTPVVFMTADPDIPTCVRAMKEGAVDFLVKPLHQDELLDALRAAHRLCLDRHRQRRESRNAAHLLTRLTVRERQVLALVLEGRKNKEIAARLDSQEATVKVHRSRLMRKLGVRSVPDLVRVADSGRLVGLRDEVRASSEAQTSPVGRGTARIGGNAIEGDFPRPVERVAVADVACAAAKTAWLAADGTWSGFTWLPASGPTRRPRAARRSATSVAAVADPSPGDPSRTTAAGC